ncbi:hypothetical protein PENTCL1PPCAC_9919, partial [Pristionchus entomophagus]
RDQRSKIEDHRLSTTRGAELVQVHAQQTVDQLGVGSLADGGQLAQVHSYESVDQLGIGALVHGHRVVGLLSGVEVGG